MNKGIKILAGVLAFVLIGGLLWFANGLVGKPISKAVATHAAKQYVKEKYADMGLEVSRASYSFKDGHYYVEVHSPTSIDTHFNISISALGKIRYDGYTSAVLEKWNTYIRLNDTYGAMVDAVFNSNELPYRSDIDFGELKDRTVVEIDDENRLLQPDYGLVIENLEIDKDYDLTELGKTAGHITFYAQAEEVSMTKAAEILMDLKRRLDEQKVSFYAIDFTLEKARGEDEKPNGEAPQISVDEFLYSEIKQPNLEERLKAAADAIEAYYAKEDMKKMELEKIVS